ncbi:Hypothetical protein Eab7_2663 [Exiguobacterium antarcticum B7]|nr:Hypothetical protein Eab7_2663 [Exiguobacterium antarcticum B7]
MNRWTKNMTVVLHCHRIDLMISSGFCFILGLRGTYYKSSI